MYKNYLALCASPGYFPGRNLTIEAPVKSKHSTILRAACAATLVIAGGYLAVSGLFAHFKNEQALKQDAPISTVTLSLPNINCADYDRVYNLECPVDQHLRWRRYIECMKAGEKGNPEHNCWAASADASHICKHGKARGSPAPTITQ